MLVVLSFPWHWQASQLCNAEMHTWTYTNSLIKCSRFFEQEKKIQLEELLEILFLSLCGKAFLFFLEAESGSVVHCWVTLLALTAPCKSICG